MLNALDVLMTGRYVLIVYYRSITKYTKCDIVGIPNIISLYGIAPFCTVLTTTIEHAYAYEHEANLYQLQ